MLGALAISAIATFQASSLIQGLGLPDLITGGDPDPQGLVKFLATLVGLVQLALALAIGLLAALAFFRITGFVVRMFGDHMAQAWQYLYARFLDHRVWMLGIGYFALLLTILLIGASGWLMTTNMFWGVDWVEELHEGLVTWAEISILLHIAAVIFESWRTGVNLPRSMITGRKRLPTSGDGA